MVVTLVNGLELRMGHNVDISIERVARKENPMLKPIYWKQFFIPLTGDEMNPCIQYVVIDMLWLDRHH